MTGTLIIVGLVALLVVALEATHRRTRRHWHPGGDRRFDRDAARTDDELRALVQADPVVEPHRPSRPRSAELSESHSPMAERDSDNSAGGEGADARLGTRVAA